MSPSPARPVLGGPLWRHVASAALAGLLAMTSPGGQAQGVPAPPAGPAAGGPPRLTPLVGGLEHPWGLAFLPDGSMLVTERVGRMRRVSADGQTVSAPLAGLPPVLAAGQGGLLDVALDPDFSRDPWVYWTYAEAGRGDASGLAGTALARGRLVGDTLQDVQVLFRQQPKTTGRGHYGARIAFADDKTLFVTLGDRQRDDPARPGRDFAQNPGVSLGKVVRLNRDGSAAAGHATLPDAFPGLWSLGHRNPQAAAVHPQTGELWLVEHGPQGGDEVNRVLPRRNYGWPLRSYGCPYGSPVGETCRVGGGVHAPDFEEPLHFWVPTSTAPSGMAFYTASRYPQWQGDLFVGALVGRVVWRLTLDGDRVVAREALFGAQRARIRDVRQGPDGRLYLLTDAADGAILRTEP